MRDDNVTCLMPGTARSFPYEVRGGGFGIVREPITTEKIKLKKRKKGKERKEQKKWGEKN